jgi:hypothetical protein
VTGARELAGRPAGPRRPAASPITTHTQCINHNHHQEVAVALTQNHNETVLGGPIRPAINPNHNETVLARPIRHNETLPGRV